MVNTHWISKGVDADGVYADQARPNQPAISIVPHKQAVNNMNQVRYLIAWTKWITVTFQNKLRRQIQRNHSQVVTMKRVMKTNAIGLDGIYPYCAVLGLVSRPPAKYNQIGESRFADARLTISSIVSRHGKIIRRQQ